MDIISVEKIITSLQRDEVLLFFCKERLSIVVLLELFEGADWEKLSAWCGVYISKSLRKVFSLKASKAARLLQNKHL